MTSNSQFSRIQLLLGKEQLQVLQTSYVVIAGLGAVGSYAMEALARSGIGRIRVVDFDTVSKTNINRQLLATHDTVGCKKTDLAIERIQRINPDCQCEKLDIFINGETAPQVIEDRPDYVIDAIDSLNSKVQLIAATLKNGLPLLSSMGAATRLDPFAIRAAPLFDTHTCPLARLIRKRLRRLGVTHGGRCIYSEEPGRPNHPDESIEEYDEEKTVTNGRPRRPLGSISTITGIFGLLAAHEVILDLLRINISRSPDF